MKITVDEARAYFAHPTQQKASGITPDDLPDAPDFHYYALDGVCLVFHPAGMRGFWMVHVGVLPTVWGKTTGPTRALLEAFWRDVGATLIIAWIGHENAAVRAYAQRVGFVEHGRMELPEKTLVEYSWRLK